jgi:hypothetical protein
MFWHEAKLELSVVLTCRVEGDVMLLGLAPDMCSADLHVAKPRVPASNQGNCCEKLGGACSKDTNPIECGVPPGSNQEVMVKVAWMG